MCFQMNVVSYEWDLKWIGLKWIGLKWAGSQMRWSQMKWSQMNGLKWIGLNCLYTKVRRSISLQSVINIWRIFTNLRGVMRLITNIKLENIWLWQSITNGVCLSFKIWGSLQAATCRSLEVRRHENVENLWLKYKFNLCLKCCRLHICRTFSVVAFSLSS